MWLLILTYPTFSIVMNKNYFLFPENHQVWESGQVSLLQSKTKDRNKLGTLKEYPAKNSKII